MKSKIFALIALAIVSAGWNGAVAIAQTTASPPPRVPLSLPPGMPQPSPEQLAEMEHRDQITQQIRATKANQQVTVRELDPLTDDRLTPIIAELNKLRTGTQSPSTGVILPVGGRRWRMELAWHSGRLARDGAYPAESRIPEGKAVQTVLAYFPTKGGSETWPPHVLPGLSPYIESGTSNVPVPMLYEMRVDVKADGSMVFALLVSLGGKQMLIPSVSVKSGEIVRVEVPGGHQIALHATLRDQKLTETEAVKLVATARSQGPQAIQDALFEIRPVFYGGPPGMAAGPMTPPANIIAQMRTSHQTEMAVRAMGAKP